MKKKMFLLGSSLLGLALYGPVTSRAEDAAPSNAAAVADAKAAAESPKDTGPKSRGFYVGTSIGGSFFEGAGKNSQIFNRSGVDSNSPADGRADAFTVDKIDDESNFLWGVFAGYRLADWLGAEVGWTDIGGFSATDRTDPGNTTPHNDRTKIKVDGVEARLRAWIPLGTDRVSAVFGPGIFIYQSESPKRCNGSDKSGCALVGNFPPTARNTPALDPREDSGQAFTLSGGLQFRITDNILLRTEYQHYFSVLDQGVDTVTASLIVGFYDFFGQSSGSDNGMGGIAVE